MPKLNKNQCSLREVYNWYKGRTVDPVDYKIHKLVLDVWGSIINEFLLEGKDIKLQQGLSVLAIRKREQKMYVDRRASRLAGKRVMMPNSHSGYYAASIYWGRRRTGCNSKGWSFIPSRKLARSLVTVMRQPYGHARFVKRARVARTEKHREGFYKYKVLKI
jgi:hypothetical protein